MIEFIFFMSAFLVLLHYVIYPVVVNVWAHARPRPSAAQDDYQPSVSLIVAAYNEERVIAQKLENSLALDYPRDRFEIIVVSDGANDRTPEIVAQYAGRGVVSLHRAERGGKTAALNRAIEVARGDIVVFSDANNDFSTDAIRRLVRHFADASVGGVTGLKQIKSAVDRHASVGDGLYWRYESGIKQAESDLGSITGADGEIFAMRKSLYRSIDPRVINDDAELTFSLIGQGYRVLYETAAKSFEYASISIADDFFVKVRMVAGGFQTVARHWRAFFPPRTRFGWMFLLHKVLRWTMPEFLILVFASSAMLAREPLFATIFWLQCVFYLLALVGWYLHRRTTVPMFVYIPLYFTSMNIAAFYGLLRYLKGSQSSAWRKAAR